jgi:hypothetical protein
VQNEIHEQIEERKKESRKKVGKGLKFIFAINLKNGKSCNIKDQLKQIFISCFFAQRARVQFHKILNVHYLLFDSIGVRSDYLYHMIMSL